MKLTRLLKQIILPFVPARMELSLRYVHAKLNGKLDKEIFLLTTLNMEKSRFIDVGANYGLWTYRMSKIFRYVEAFEPQADCLKVISRANLENVNVHQIGVSSVNDIMTLGIPNKGDGLIRGLASFENMAGNLHKISVQVRTLDSFNFRDVDLIKIDVEGHEDSVITGAIETIKHSHPVLVIEIEKRHRIHPPSKLFDLLQTLGYDSFYINSDNQLASTHGFCWNSLQNPEKIGSNEYICNFIFIPSGKIAA